MGLPYDVCFQSNRRIGGIELRFINTKMDLKISVLSKKFNHVLEVLKVSNLGLFSETEHRHDSSLDITTAYTNSPLFGTNERLVKFYVILSAKSSDIQFRVISGFQRLLLFFLIGDPGNNLV